MVVDQSTNLAFVSRRKVLSTCMTLVLGPALGSALVSCKSGVDDKRSHTSSTAATEATTATGAAGNQDQVISHSDDDNNRVAEVTIPTGALAINQEVSVSSSYNTDPSDLKTEFGIDANANIKQTNIATVVSSNIDQNLAKPMTIALELPQAAASLLNILWDSRNFFIVYTVRDSVQDTWKRGIMPEDQLTLKGDRIEFESELMGRYEMFESVEPIKATTAEKTISKPDFVSPPVAITGVTPVVAKPGDTIVVTGKYFSAKTTLTAGGTTISQAQLVTSQKLTFTFPQLAFGPTELKATDGSNSATIEVISHSKSAALPYVGAEASQVCAGLKFFNRSGTQVIGTKDCGPSLCSADTQTNCLATQGFPAYAASDIDYSKVFADSLILGRNGEKPVPSITKACLTSGQQDCMVSSGFFALEAGKIQPNMIKKDHTVPKAGVGGADVKGTFPTLQDPLPGKVHGMDYLHSSTFVNDIAGALKTVQFWDINGGVHEYQTQGPIAESSILQNVEIFGKTGPIPGGKTPCNKSGQGNCQATLSYVTVDKTKFVPGNIKNTIVVGTITGTFPSDRPDSKLTAAQSAITALTSQSFDIVLRSNESFEYFDSTGQRFTAAGSSELKPSNIRFGKTIFGVAGTLNEVNDGDINANDVRKGVVIGPTTGKIPANCRNLAKLASFSYTPLPGKEGVDPFDVVPDYVYPTENPWPEGSAVVCNGDQWQELSTSCAGAVTDCVFKHRATPLRWSGYTDVAGTWDTANSTCESISIDGYNNWRLPTYKELTDAYTKGIYYLSQNYPGFLQPSNNDEPELWTSTEPTGQSTKKMTLNLKVGGSAQEVTTNAKYRICVHAEPPAP